jgi:phospholipase C
LLQKQHSVVKILRIRLTWRINLNNLSTQQVGKIRPFWAARRLAAGGVVAGLFTGLAACGIIQLQSPQEAVKERAQARWNLLVKGDITGAYGFFSPGSRAVASLESYRNSVKPGFWKSAVVEKVDCASVDSCDAVATIEYEIQGRRIKTPLKETWIREGSNWWYVQK